MFATFVLVVAGWIIFRSESLSQALAFFYCMFSQATTLTGFIPLYLPFALIMILMFVEWITREKEHALSIATGPFQYKTVRWLTYYVMVLAIYRCWGFSQEFIYFQF